MSSETFSYKGISAGRYVEGNIEAVNQDEASFKLKAKKIIRVKANLSTKKDINLKSKMHIDTSIENSITSVYYINTNNGFTLFENGKKYFFASLQKHIL